VLNASRGEAKPTKRKGRRENVAISTDDKVAGPHPANKRSILQVSDPYRPFYLAADHLAASRRVDESATAARSCDEATFRTAIKRDNRHGCRL